MKYFVDPDTHWDIEGYWKQFGLLEPRLPGRTFAILSRMTFHDGDVLSVRLENLRRQFQPCRRKDPTEVTIHVRHRDDGRVYALRYQGVTATEFTFDWRTESYIGLDDLEHFWTEDHGGIHDWRYDELTPHSEEYLSHEVTFGSGARLHLVFRRITCTRVGQPRQPRVVCLCGSTRFREAFAEANRRETLAGKIVLSIASYTQSDDELFAGLSPVERGATERKLADLHRHKIDLADEVLVLNVGGYIGEATRSEVEYAHSHGKTVRFWE
jgi:hypothetical protein